MTNIKTIIKSKHETAESFHYFMPSLAIELALREGVSLNQNIIKKIKSHLRKSENKGYYKWSNNYPSDYDSTITVLNMFNLLGELKQLKLDFTFAEEGGIFTYKGGFKTKENNNVDLLINVRILDYLQNHKTKSYAKLLNFLKNKKQEFFKPVTEISKYYCSEGFLLYCLSKVSSQLDLNMDDLIDAKKDNFLSKSDIQMAFLANPSRKDLIGKINSISEHSFYLFQHPRLGLKFSNPFLEDIINNAADNKINPSFNQWISQIYNTKGKELYSYKKHAINLIDLFEKHSIDSNDAIIELAVGTGNFLENIVSEYRITGIDKSKFMLEEARKKLTKSKLLQMDVKDLELCAKCIYSLNFIDLYDSGNVEIWADTYQEAKEIIDKIMKQVENEGYFFLHKKETKKNLHQTKLKNIKQISGYNLKNIYLYQDENMVYRNEFNKINIPFAEFNTKLNNCGLNKVDENDSWIIYQKKI